MLITKWRWWFSLSVKILLFLSTPMHSDIALRGLIMPVSFLLDNIYNFPELTAMIDTKFDLLNKLFYYMLVENMSILFICNHFVVWEKCKTSL